MSSILFMLAIIVAVFLLPILLSYSILRSIFIESDSSLDKITMWVISILFGWIVCFVIFPILTVYKVLGYETTVTQAELDATAKAIEESRTKKNKH